MKLYMKITKQTLRAHSLLYAELELQKLRLEEMMDTAPAVSAKPPDGQPRARITSDPTTTRLSQEEEIRERIKDISRTIDRERAIIRVKLKRIEPMECAVLEMRYLDRCKWNRISMLMFGGRKDFEEKKESYLRGVYRIHGNALSHICEITKTGG